MEETFLKSSLPVYDVLALEDTSLALPAEPTPRSSTGLDSDERSLRVQQQVQLTLRRKATKKSLSNGKVRFYKLFCHFNVRNKGAVNTVNQNHASAWFHASQASPDVPTWRIILLGWLCSCW